MFGEGHDKICFRPELRHKGITGVVPGIVVVFWQFGNPSGLCRHVSL